MKRTPYESSYKQPLTTTIVLAVVSGLVITIAAARLLTLDEIEPDRAHRQAVRAYLRETLPEPTWQEVRWEPAERNTIVLRYRFKHGLGGPMNLRSTFTIKAGKVIREKWN